MNLLTNIVAKDLNSRKVINKGTYSDALSKEDKEEYFLFFNYL